MRFYEIQTSRSRVMQQFAFRHTERGIRKRQAEAAQVAPAVDPKHSEAIMRGLEDARLQKEHEAKAKVIELQIADLQKQLKDHEPLLIKSEFRKIEERASRIFRIPIASLKSQRRFRRLVMARQFVMYWASRRTQLSYPLIGRLMGGRDHTTIMAGREAYQKKRAAMGRTLRDAR